MPTPSFRLVVPFSIHRLSLRSQGRGLPTRYRQLEVEDVEEEGEEKIPVVRRASVLIIFSYLIAARYR